MKLQINVPVSGLDLANLLQGEEGFFLCQNRGQNFIAVAKAGHSIAFGPTPIGRLQGEEGFFLCQNRGQNFIAVAKAGHSIAFGPTPIGRGIIEQPSATLGPEPWVVTKISNSTEFAEFHGTMSGREMR